MLLHKLLTRNTMKTASKPTLRVASVLPSATELLCFIGGQHLLVGRSHEDNYPSSITHLPMLTDQLISREWTSAKEVDSQVSAALASGHSLYFLNTELLASLQPDLILTQDLCSVCAIDLEEVNKVAAAMNPSPNVLSMNPQSLEDVIECCTTLGEAVGLQREALKARRSLERRIEIAKSVADSILAGQGATPLPRVKVAFVEWSDPIYVGGHWTPQLIHMAGGYHTLNPGNEGSGLPGSYVQVGGAGKSFPVSSASLTASDPDLIIVCPCGLTLPSAIRETDKLMTQEWFRSLRAVSTGRVLVVDGDAMFNRPGPRLVDALEWLVSVLHEPSHQSNPTQSQQSQPQQQPQQQQQPPQQQAIKPPQPPPQQPSTLDGCHAQALLLRPANFPYVNYFDHLHRTHNDGNNDKGVSGGGSSSRSSDNDLLDNDLLVSVLSSSSSSSTTSSPNLRPSPSLNTKPSPSPSAKASPSPVEVAIEEAHLSACRAGKSTYNDPATGYTVFTEAAHRQRGKCCGNKCRHCPYGHYNVKEDQRSSAVKIAVPTLLRAVGRKRVMVGTKGPVGVGVDPNVWETGDAVACKGKESVSDEKGDGQGSGEWQGRYFDVGEEKRVNVVFWSGGKDSYLSLLFLEQRLIAKMDKEQSHSSIIRRNTSTSQEKIVLLTHFDGSTGKVEHQGLSVNDIMKQAKSLGLDLFLVPLHSSGSSNVSYTESVVQGLQILQQELQADVIRTASPNNLPPNNNNNNASPQLLHPPLRLVFGDLHLEDIRAWREATFSSPPHKYPCVFPLFRRPYEQLQQVLWNSQDLVQIVVSAWTGPVGGQLKGEGAKEEGGVVHGQVGVEKKVGEGSIYDATFVSTLPEGVDSMGERGEFHTHCQFR